MIDPTASRVCRLLSLRLKYYPDVIIDFGLGDAEELQYFRRYWKNAYVIGLEPRAPIKEYQVNKFYQVVVANSTLSHLIFYLRGRAETSSLYPLRKSRKRKVEQIKLNELYEIHKLKDKKILLWVDCEGSELDALLGGLKLLPYVNYIYVEVNSIARFPFGNNNRTVLEVLQPFLLSQGFELTKRFGKLKRVHTRLYRNRNTLLR